MRDSRRLWIALILIVVAGCGEAKQAARAGGATVTLTMTDAGCQYAGPAQVRPGRLVAHLDNQTGDRMFLAITDLQQGHTYQEFVVYVDAERFRQLSHQPVLGPPAWASGGVNTTAQAHSSSADLKSTLSQGTYVFACGRIGTDANGKDTELGIWAAGPIAVTTQTSQARPSPSSATSSRLAGVITETSADCTLLVDPGPLATGRISLEMQNETGTSAGFDVWLIPPGHTFAAMAAHVREERRLAEAGQPGLGHPAFMLTNDPSIHGGPDAGKAFSASGRLDPGEYAVVCLRIFSQVGQVRPQGIAGPLSVH